MGAYDRAGVYTIILLFHLNILVNKFNKNSIGLYKNDGLAMVIVQIKYVKKESGLSLEIKAT